ncbi:MAG: hypothetical protein EAY81_06235 [Bacteroidetes bacterium]|nr:MAG: hypothetical protein EAY81_06235 [Bacteroidota bacterium]
MKQIYWIISGVFWAMGQINAQGIHGVIGAEAWMQGGVSSTLSNVYAVVNNPSQISYLKKWQAGVYSEQRFNRKELTLANFSIAFPNKVIDVGLAVNYFGFQDFNQQRVALSAAKKLAETFSLGVQLNYVATNIKEYGTAGALVLGAGVTYQPVKKIEVALTIFNPSQQQLSNQVSDIIPAFARLGVKYIVSNKVYTTFEVDQQLEQKTVFRGGIRYDLHKRVAVAIGVANQPTLFTFGTSMLAGNLSIEAAATIHQTFGFTPQLGLRLPIQHKQ